MSPPRPARPADAPAALARLLRGPAPVLALAPMQDVTDLPFWRLLAARGGPDIYWTEYFRVHGTSRPNAGLVACLDENPSDRPAIAQVIGNEPTLLAAAARELARRPVAAIDLNLGCPAPVVYRKCAGGGLLRDLPRVDAILGAMRAATRDAGVAFTVKTRIGFANPDDFPRLLEIFARHGPDLVTVHARTVTDGYRAAPRYDYVRQAVLALPCPVLANGSVETPAAARAVLAATGARGLMIGRGCVRNPWIFDAMRAALAGAPAPAPPRARDVLAYVEDLWTATVRPESPERTQVEHMKRYMNFIGLGVGASAAESSAFLWRIRRATTRNEFFDACRDHLDRDGTAPEAPWGEAMVIGGE